MFGKRKPQFTDEMRPEEQGSFVVSTFGPKAARWIFAVLEIVQIGVLSLAFVILIRTFIVQPFYVKGASMEPSFNDHEYLLIDEVTYRLRDPLRGEIVVFRYPKNPREFFIKRIIGLPGETVEIKEGRIRIASEAVPGGFILNESYLDDLSTGGDRRVRLADSEYYLLGDNRDASLDSRIFGPVKRQFIVGRVWVRGWPLDRIDKFETPQY